MDRSELISRYFDAWNNKKVADLLRLMHPQASYYDAFWQESCSDKHLKKFFATSFEMEPHWYRPYGDPIPTPNGVIARYEAFRHDDKEGTEPVFNGAEVFTVSGGLILTISDYYCDPTVEDLVEVAKLAEGQHGRAHTVQQGLGGKRASAIQKRLAELPANSAVILDPELTVTKLADHIGCEVMHLFHVLEEIQNTSFIEFVNECRTRHASTLLIDPDQSDLQIDQIADKCGFESAADLNAAFQKTFGLEVDEYRNSFAGKQ